MLDERATLRRERSWWAAAGRHRLLQIDGRIFQAATLTSVSKQIVCLYVRVIRRRYSCMLTSYKINEGNYITQTYISSR